MITKTAVVVLTGCLMIGCRSSHTDKSAPPTASEQSSIKQASVDEVARLVKEKTATVVDANGSDTRREYGVIPGALLLSNHREYAMSELPASKASKLVFYCGGTMCRASDKAASRALAAGYNDVSVLRDGIKGWKSAGQPTEMPQS